MVLDCLLNQRRLLDLCNLYIMYVCMSRSLQSSYLLLLVSGCKPFVYSKIIYAVLLVLTIPFDWTFL
ncbi:hypothetical protein RIF29_07931 [Crotalaria pallida]|uniref:Uncharacterized protein n=1 Tax=Crotalaria pallida TaxID=3830 RepID=A0AAN9PBL8_CROPI